MYLLIFSSSTTVKSTNTANGQFLNRKAMRSTLIATLSLRAKMQNLPELGDLHQAIGSLRVETKTANQTTIRDTRTIRVDIQQNTRPQRQNNHDESFRGPSSVCRGRENHISISAAVRIPTYVVLACDIRTSSRESNASTKPETTCCRTTRHSFPPKHYFREATDFLDLINDVEPMSQLQPGTITYMEERETIG
ncbi:hypothetical protein CSPAE12_03777 [Colletotrichum incanum]|nr:hypothetical protein CSPAE12_03777 [Colletotrichum incanum]